MRIVLPRCGFAGGEASHVHIRGPGGCSLARLAIGAKQLEASVYDFVWFNAKHGASMELLHNPYSLSGRGRHVADSAVAKLGEEPLPFVTSQGVTYGVLPV